jgi:hypothetical protein
VSPGWCSAPKSLRTQRVVGESKCRCVLRHSNRQAHFLTTHSRHCHPQVTPGGKDFCGSPPPYPSPGCGEGGARASGRRSGKNARVVCRQECLRSGVQAGRPHHKREREARPPRDPHPFRGSFDRLRMTRNGGKASIPVLSLGAVPTGVLRGFGFSFALYLQVTCGLGLVKGPIGRLFHESHFLASFGLTIPYRCRFVQF